MVIEWNPELVIPFLHDKSWVRIVPYDSSSNRPCYTFQNGNIIGIFPKGILFGPCIGGGKRCVGSFYAALTDEEKGHFETVFVELLELIECSEHAWL